jgi:hypothetical protein
MEKNYKTIETEPVVAREPMASYGHSVAPSPLYSSSREKMGRSAAFPGLFTEEEKKARLKEAIESIRNGKGISEEEMDIFCESLV